MVPHVVRRIERNSYVVCYFWVIANKSYIFSIFKMKKNDSFEINVIDRLYSAYYFWVIDSGNYEFNMFLNFWVINW